MPLLESQDEICGCFLQCSCMITTQSCLDALPPTHPVCHYAYWPLESLNPPPHHILHSTGWGPGIPSKGLCMPSHVLLGYVVPSQIVPCKALGWLGPIPGVLWRPLPCCIGVLHGGGGGLLRFERQLPPPPTKGCLGQWGGGGLGGAFGGGAPGGAIWGGVGGVHAPKANCWSITGSPYLPLPSL